MIPDAPEDPSTETDVEAGWPPRFTAEFIALAGILLLAAAIAAAVFLKSIMVPADATAQHIMAYVFTVAGLLMLLAGALFGLLEARRPPPVQFVVQPPNADEVREAFAALSVQPGLAAAQITQVIEAVVKVSGAISKEKRSTAAWSIGFGLLLLAGVASGLVSLSVGDGDDGANEEPTEEASEGVHRGLTLLPAPGRNGAPAV